MNKIDLNHRGAIVTGGAQGIGLAIVKRMLASGASVRIWDRDQKLPQQTLSGLSGPVSGDAVDVADQRSVAQGTAIAAVALGKIDILVNRVGGMLIFHWCGVRHIRRPRYLLRGLNYDCLGEAARVLIAMAPAAGVE